MTADSWINSGWTRTAIQLIALGIGGFYALSKFENAVSIQIGQLQTQIAADYRELDGRMIRLENTQIRNERKVR